MASKTRLIVGIDFGTTYSGFSWAVNSGLKTVNLVTDWETSNAYSATDEKVRTWISYTGTKPTSFGNTAVGKPFRWFKVLLQPDHYSQGVRDVRDANVGLREFSKSLEEVISDYLGWLWLRGKEDIARKQGHDFESRFDLRVILTVPAAWKPIAKDRTLRAAKRAGLPDDIHLVTEPEAAALATLSSKSDEAELQKGDVFVVCDAGGGTVDLISYEVLNPSPLQIKECGVGEGDLCGSAFLDLGFEHIIKTKIGEEKYNSTKEKDRKKMLLFFEHCIKFGFDGNINKVHSVELRGAGSGDDPEEDDDQIEVKGHIRQNQIKQVKAEGRMVKAILLVGGFGRSNYLHSRLDKTYRRQGINVLQARNPWSAVCRGATLWGLEREIVVSRNARYNYGYAVNVEFDATKHDVSDRYYDASEGIDRAKDQMEWLLRWGEEIQAGRVLEWEDYNTIKENELQSRRGTTKSFTRNFYYSDLPQAPTRKCHDVIPLLSLNFQIETDKILKTSKSRKGNDGEYCRDVYFKMEIELRNADLDFTVLYDGEKVAYIKANYKEKF
ncbi:hypothetical protein H072_7151 [Dactylellina haptotyla CBS 200.50]|uniref:Actin-like ATPase domain-containing protein n=1 Tax=Dactylellina haptotyla (strain CBS 200.50) TaxID=1284197 RepID=S8AD80_DACHA|nr:hypothetical protein H072_7151 [Dactylellina haptotyla CBS 200.50]